MAAIKVPSVFTAVDKFSKPVKKMERAGVSFADKVEAKFAKTNRVIDRLTPSFGALGSQVLAFAGIAGGIALASKMAEIQQRTEAARLAVQQFTGATGDALDSVTAKVSATANMFGEDLNKTLVAANTLSKQMGISFDEAIAKIQQGFLIGANNSGELLDIVREYPVFMKEAGLSADAFFKVINQQVKQGIYSDKGIDAIKEANIRIREATPATVAALEGIGLASDKLLKGLSTGALTTFDVMQQVSERLNKLPANSQKVGTAIADIFGGPGEDAGLEFLKTLRNIDKTTGDLSKGFTDVEKTQNNLLNANVKLELAYNKLFGGTNKEIVQLKANFIEFIADALIKIAPEINRIIRTTSKWLSENGSMLLKVIKIALVYFGTLKAIRILIPVIRGAIVAWNIALGINSALQKKSLFALRANTVALRTQLVVTKIATVAQRAFNLVMSLNPIGAIITGVLALAAGITLLTSKLKANTRAQRINSEVQNKALANTIEQRIEVDTLFRSLRKVAVGSERFNQILNRINEIQPGIVEKYDLQAGALKNITKAEKELKGAIIERAKAEAIAQLIQEKTRQLLTEKIEGPSTVDKLTGFLLGGTGIGSLLFGEDIAQSLQADRIAGLNKDIDALISRQNEVVQPVNLEATRERVNTERQELIERGQLDININDQGGNATVDDSRLATVPVRVNETFGF